MCLQINAQSPQKKIYKKKRRSLDPWEIFVLPKISILLCLVEKNKVHPTKKSHLKIPPKKPSRIKNVYYS